MPFDFVTHQEIAIESPAASIWPLIENPSPWKAGRRVEHVSGPLREPGGIFAVTEETSGAVYYVQNIELIRSQRRTVKLLSGKEGVAIGYATWRLVEQGRVTIVSYDVYAQVETLTNGGNPLEERGGYDERAAEYVAAESARLKSELVFLKRLIEIGQVDERRCLTPTNAPHDTP